MQPERQDPDVISTAEKPAEEPSYFMAPGRPLYIVSAIVGMIHRWRPSTKVRRILIYKLDHLGDLLIATPALRAIRHRFPGAEIKIVIGEWSRPVIENNPNVDDIVIYNSPRFARSPYTSHSFGSVRRQLRGWKPDLVIGLRDDWDTVLSSVLSRAKRIERGRAHMMEWFRRFRTKEAFEHELERLWDTLRPLDVASNPSEHLDFFLKDSERVEAAQFMEAHGIRRPFAVLHSGATQQLREWPLERYAEIARKLVARYGMQIVLVGVARETERSASLAAMIQDLDPIDISGRLGLRPTAGLFEMASLYLGSDGGAMHVAAAVGVPTIGLFGPGSYHVFQPVGENTIGISHLFPCSPCNQTLCIRPHDTCMQAIQEDEVMEAIERLVGVPMADRPVEIVLPGELTRRRG